MPLIIRQCKQKMATRLATIDLGSNSFHMLIVEVHSKGEHQVIARQKQKVQLRAGLNDLGEIDLPTQERALKCFERFAQKIALHDVDHVDVVGTYTLRVAKNLSPFLEKAEAILGHPIRIISGEEEARLIYVGASTGHELNARHLIIDIGGGSTELVVGESNQILALASLDMGCVSFQQRFFENNTFTVGQFEAASDVAIALIKPILDEYLALGWSLCLGTSGTVQAIHAILKKRKQKLNLGSLLAIRNELLKMGSLAEMDFPGLRADRENILAGGLVVLIALFEQFNIEEMQLSSGAVREGVLAELLARVTP